MNGIAPRELSRRAAVLLTALACSALAACSMAQEAGAAAIVDEERIPVDRLQELTADLVDAGGDVDPQTRQPFAAGEAQRRTLEKLIASRILAEAAAQQGVEVTQGDVDERYAEFVELAGGDEAVTQGLALARNVPPSYARQYVRDLVTSEVLATDLVPGSPEDPEVLQERQQALNDLLIETGAGMEITVNPRYGQWEPDSGAITALVSGGLSRGLDDATEDIP